MPVALGTAARVRRGPGPEGREALLVRSERERFSALLTKLPKPKQQQLHQLVKSVPAGAAQALMMKAASARARRLGSDARALLVLERFAAVLKSTLSTQLLVRASVLDLDSRKSTSNVDLSPMWQKRGTVRVRPGDGAATDNDGLLQRFTATCGPTVIQMMRAQADPVLAFAITKEGLGRDAVTGVTARFQRELLEEFGGVAVGRRESWVMARLNNALARLGRPDRSLSAANLAAVRAAYQGFPSDDDVKRVRAAVIPKRDEGLGFEQFQKMLDRYVSPLTGARYAQTAPADGFARGQAWRHLDAVERALKAGFDVPFGLCEPAHWMLISAVRGQAPARDLLVSDPDGGRTAWVNEKAFVDGSFAREPFRLPKTGERPYVDSFYLPQRTT
ncbi:MAG: hypothetical protein JNK82_19425 [Myxococcaceae bacterium]|nr:hypothetical protein [Myxococcaceae bacterium]